MFFPDYHDSWLILFVVGTGRQSHYSCSQPTMPEDPDSDPVSDRLFSSVSTGGLLDCPNWVLFHRKGGNPGGWVLTIIIKQLSTRSKNKNSCIAAILLLHSADFILMSQVFENEQQCTTACSHTIVVQVWLLVSITETWSIIGYDNNCHHTVYSSECTHFSVSVVH